MNYFTDCLSPAQESDRQKLWIFELKNVSVKECGWVPPDTTTSHVSHTKQLSPKGVKEPKPYKVFKNEMKCLPQGVITIRVTHAVIRFSSSVENASYPIYLTSLSCPFSPQL